MSIRYGDRLFVRLVIGGRTVMEFMIECMHDLSELICELRRRAVGLRGLGRLYVRNASAGQSIERPMMLYADGRGEYASVGSGYAPRTMYHPWETH